MLLALADVHVDYAIVQGLRRRGMDVVRAQDKQFDTIDDEVLLDLAASLNRVLLTNDTDFLEIHSRWLTAGRSHRGIIFWPQRRRRVGEVVRRIVTLANQMTDEEFASQIQFL